MTEPKDLLNMLTTEDSKRVADAIIQAQSMTERFRQMDHDAWMAREDEKTALRITVDQHQRSHILLCNILNLITTGGIIALILIIIARLL